MQPALRWHREPSRFSPPTSSITSSSCARFDPLPAGAYFGISESTDQLPNETRIAFWASDRAEVDRVTAAVAAAGAKDVRGPQEMPYGPGYYAAYFTDPAGNRFEVYHRPPL